MSRNRLRVQARPAIESLERRDAPATLTNLATDRTTINEGDLVTLTGSITGTPLASTTILQVDWGDGSAPDRFAVPAGATSISRTHVYLDDNPSGTPSDTATIRVTPGSTLIAGPGTAGYRAFF